MGFVSELRRRNVFRMAVLYVVASWLIMQVADVLKDLANLPDWIGPVILALLAIGFPIALVLSWFYELTPEGISLDEDVDRVEAVTQIAGRRVDFIIIAMLAAAVILFAWDKWRPRAPIDQSIAVLAFENMSGDPEQEYFADGISEELLNLLAKVPDLRVTSRSSAFSFKGKDTPVPVLAEQLKVAHVLEGSVRKDGDRVRITAQLIEAPSDRHLWSETYDREFDDIFAVQSEIAAAIVAALRPQLLAPEDAAPAVSSVSVSAYDLYLQGRELIRHRNAGEAFEVLGRAVRLDNSFAPAHAQLAIAMMLAHRGSPEAVHWHLDQADKLEPGLGEAHAARALLANFLGDPETAANHARKALESNPSDINAMNWLHVALRDLGQYAEAYAIIEQMLEKDPLSNLSRWHYIGMLNETGRIEESRQMADQLVADGQVTGVAAHARRSLWFEGDIDEGLKWGFKAGFGSGNYVFVWAAFGMAGVYDEARRFLFEFDMWVDTVEGKWEAALETTQENLRREPDNMEYVLDAAGVLYGAGRIDEATPLYERLYMPTPDAPMTFNASNRGPTQEPIPVMRLMRLAYGRRLAGDEAGAQAAADFARRGHEILLGAGHRNMNRSVAEAMLAAFDGRKDDAIAALQSAIRYGLRARAGIEDPIFDVVRDEPGFVELEKELEAILAAEHAEVLQLICFDNPVPNDWQPLPDTCAGVVEGS